ncbi:hypothetical protein KAR91_57320 [Candidatus Pacearchaeota archaeon]|nr:hypothetical protein [Candidatus Pacearchaeota archaeon]
MAKKTTKKKNVVTEIAAILHSKTVTASQMDKIQDELSNHAKPTQGNPRYPTAKSLEDAINNYFQNDIKTKKVVVGKGANQRTEEIEVPTICGLAYSLGFASRQSFYDMETRPELSYTVKRARLFIECEYEQQLQIGNTIGAIFALKNMGWKDKVEQEHGVTDGFAEALKEIGANGIGLPIKIK